LARFLKIVTRSEVHLADENSDKSGINDKRCLIEARPVNKPVVSYHADTTEKAFHGALDKIKKCRHGFRKQKAY
jgi:hypothetical protein